MANRAYATYILASRPRGALYVGVTNDLARRVAEHRGGAASAHTRKYKIHQLVWYAMAADVDAAIALEKRIKRWRRAWKLTLIEEMNPGWADLAAGLAV